MKIVIASLHRPMKLGIQALLFASVLQAATLPVDISFERDVISILTTKGCNG